MRTGWRRVGAWLIDCACVLGWAGVTAIVGVPLYLAGLIRPTGTVALNVVGALVVVLPVVIAAAVFESRRGAATPGKRALRLRVSTSRGRPSFSQALLRNGLKIGLPWLLGHAAVFALISSGSTGAAPSAAADLALVLAYVLPIAYVICLFVGRGLTPYDRVAGTQVTGPS